MSPAPFRVFPFDFFADASETAPHVETIQISGAARRFELLPRGERVYFRLQNDTSRLWATLDDCGEEDFVRTFRRAVGSGRIGRVFERQNEASCKFVYVLAHNDGAASVRDWATPHWASVAASRQSQSYVSAWNGKGIWHPAWSPPLRHVLEAGSEAMNAAAFWSSDRDWTRMRFLRGEERELELLSLALSLRVRFGHDNTRYHFPLWHHPRRNSVWVSGPDALRLNFYKQLQELFAQHYFVAGLVWKRTFHDSAKDLTREEHFGRRGGWSEDALSLNIQPNTQPSAHEQIEARFFAREWLSDKLPASQVEEIFCHVHA